MKSKPRIAIVGPGNLGSALALSLHACGFEIDEILAHTEGGSLSRARRLARRVGARAGLSLAGSEAQLIWFCVPDSAIASAARHSARNIAWKGKVALHSSGALTSDELDVLRTQGAAVASVHPLMTFVRGSTPALAGVAFAIEGDRAAVRVARSIVHALGGEAYAVSKSGKAAYHTWATFTSPLLTALLATAERVAQRAGVNRKEASQRMLPILQQTLANYAELGAPAAFSGPIVRGDLATVRKHLNVLRGNPAARHVYAALAQSALEYLPVKRKSSLRQLLDSSRA
jgi:predicted short-subunit dehydrogenase-like oxidoreductase (DUF2520 family)